MTSRGLERRLLGRTGIPVTFIGFGALSIGRDWGLGGAEERRRPGTDEAARVLNGALDLGVNLIDTARAYHASEERIGLAVANRRAEYVLATKCGEHTAEPKTYYDFSYKAISESIALSRRLLKSNVIDLLQIHFGPEGHKVLDDGETVAAMQMAQREGHVRFLGASCDGDLARRCIDMGVFDVMQLGYSLIQRGNEDNIRLCGERQIGVLIRGGLARGKLTSKAVAHTEDFPEREKVQNLLRLAGSDEMLTGLATHFLYRNPHISSVLIGTKNLNHLRQDLGLLDQPVAEERMQQVLAMGA